MKFEFHDNSFNGILSRREFFVTIIILSWRRKMKKFKLQEKSTIHSNKSKQMMMILIFSSSASPVYSGNIFGTAHLDLLNFTLDFNSIILEEFGTYYENYGMTHGGQTVHTQTETWFRNWVCTFHDVDVDHF